VRSGDDTTPMVILPNWCSTFATFHNRNIFVWTMSRANNTIFAEYVFDFQTFAYYMTDFVTEANVCAEGEGT